MKKIYFFISTLLIATLLVACSGDKTNKQSETDTNEQSQKKSGGIFNVAIWTSPGGIFNPALATDSYDFLVTDLVFQSLLQLNPDYEFEGLLADSWETSKDGKEFTFHIRDGVTWHDGEPFTAEDVKYSFEYLADPNYPGARGSYVDSIVGVEEFRNGEADEVSGIQIKDGNTVVIKTKDVYSSGLLRFGTNIQMIPKHIWEKEDISKALESTKLLRNPIGTGAFKIDEFVPDQYISFLPYENYWQGKPKLDKFIIQVANEETAQAQMLSGEIDFMYLSQLNNDDIELFESQGINVFEVTYNAYQYMGFNHTMKIFQDKSVRQAFAYAVNRKAVVDDILEGHGSVASNPYPEGFWANAGDELEEYEYNPKKAIEMLEAAGWDYNESENVMYYNNKPVTFVLKYSSGNKVREQCASIFQQNFKDIGIKIELQVMEFATLYDQAKRGDFELALIGQGNEMDGDIKKFYYSDLIEELGSNAGSNFIRYSNEKVDRLIDEGFKYTDQEKRVPIYKELSKLLNEELPVVYIYHWPEGRAVTKKLKGFVETPYKANYYYNVQNWYLED